MSKQVMLVICFTCVSRTSQVEEIQANAAEALVNATRNHGEEVATRIHSLGISPLVLMCGSDNVLVRRLRSDAQKNHEFFHTFSSKLGIQRIAWVLPAAAPSNLVLGNICRGPACVRDILSSEQPREQLTLKGAITVIMCKTQKGVQIGYDDHTVVGCLRSCFLASLSSPWN